MTFPLSLLTGGLGFLKSISWKVWAAAGFVIAVMGLWSAHTHSVSHARSAGDRAGYSRATAKVRAAQAKADTLAHAHVAAVITKQDKISTEQSHGLISDFAAIDARAAAVRVRHDNASAARAVHLSTAREAAPGACPPSDNDGLSFDALHAKLTEAEKQAALLNRIWNWEDGQDAVLTEAPHER